MTAQRDAYEKLVESGKGKLRRTQILTFMATHPGQTFTRSELAALIPMRLSTVCGQIHPLLQSGEVVSVGRRCCKITGENVNELRLRQLF